MVIIVVIIAICLFFKFFVFEDYCQFAYISDGLLIKIFGFFQLKNTLNPINLFIAHL